MLQEGTTKTETPRYGARQKETRIEEMEVFQHHPPLERFRNYSLEIRNEFFFLLSAFE